MYDAIKAPNNCIEIYKKASVNLIFLSIKNPIVTPGLKWAPEYLPNI